MSEIEYARLEPRGGQAALLKGVKVTGDLRGLLFEATVEQRFSNPTDTNIEVVYTFPLPWGAVLLGVDVLLGEKRLSSAVVEKKQAEARYEETLSEGNAAIMLEKNHDLSYSLNLGNLAAYEDCVIALRYAQTLQFEQRGLRLIVPTVIAPRYGDAIADGGMQPHQSTEHSVLVDYPFDIELRVHGSMAQARVASPSHPIGFAHSTTDAGGMLTVTLGRRGSLDRDFVLVVDQLAHESDVVMARDFVEADAVVVQASFCPRISAQGSTNVAIKVLVDCSGSMAGDSIEAAKRGLQAVVRQFGQGDRFSLSRFGSTVEHRSRGLWSVTDATKLAAQRWVKDLDADLGGTEMEAALGSTFALAHTVASDLLVVTDGEIHAIDESIESARASGHRLFVVGIGSSPSESHLRRLADATGGACDFVAPGEAVEPAVLRMFARLRSPRMPDVKLVWPEGIKPQWQSPFPASVFDGDTVNVFALLKQVPAGDLCLMGSRSDSSEPEEIARATFGGPMQQHDTLSRLAANQRVQTAGADMQADVATTAARLAVAYQLISDHTNFLLVHLRDEGDKPKDMPELQKVAQMMAAGWSGVGSVVTSTMDALFESRSIDYSASDACDAFDVGAPVFARSPAPASVNDGNTPAVYRSARSNSVMFSRNIDLDAPSFLRKQSDGIDKADPRHWCQSDHYTGLTPLGLCELLRNTPAIDWPKTYIDLHRIELGVSVIDWLELAVANYGGQTISEGVVVASFLYVMTQRDTYESLMKPIGTMENVKIIARRLKDMFTAKPVVDHPEIDATLVGFMLAALADMKADAWPDQVDALAIQF